MAIRFVAAIIAALFLSAGATAALHKPVDAPAVVMLQLNDRSTAPQLSEQLPQTVTFENRMGTAQIARLAKPLETAGTETPSSYRSGDVAYWAAEQSLVVFLSDGSGVPPSGLVMVGQVSGGLPHLLNCPVSCAARLTVGAG